MGLDTPAWDATTFTKNRQRLVGSEAGRAFPGSTVQLAESPGLLVDERHEPYQTSVKRRPWVEEVFGWAKSEGRMHQARLRGLPKVGLPSNSPQAATTC